MSEIDLLIQELRDTIDNQKEEIDRLNNLNKQLVEECQRLDDEETRLNNIINELENTIVNFIENHTESYIDWKYDREIYLAESNILQKLFDTYLDKLKELKENNK